MTEPISLRLQAYSPELRATLQELAADEGLTVDQVLDLGETWVAEGAAALRAVEARFGRAATARELMRALMRAYGASTVGAAFTQAGIAPARLPRRPGAVHRSRYRPPASRRGCCARAQGVAR
jgi:hypothetical protein